MPFIYECSQFSRYSIDFALAGEKIAIEVDGDYWHRDPERDHRKDTFLASKGWRVLRFNQTETEDSNLHLLVASRIGQLNRPDRDDTATPGVKGGCRD